ncbi:MAG TPA: lytic transglycosylase domain-containing protein [Gammaproteobacteria bacterium]|nr:lytic transglycosylase domain-containing protein [Gammaproteobacteria bacterium]
MNRHVIRLSLLVAALSGAASAGDRVYHYQGEDGTPLFTDKKVRGVQLVSIKYYGRPTAVSSCNMKRASVKRRISRYQSHIKTMARRYDVDSELIKAVIITESCFNPRAVSPVGARGLMQLMPATASMLGVSDPFDPEENISGGVRYLRMMLDEFNQNKKLALAAYNAGPNAVKKYGKVPPFPETQHYVKKILGMI